MTSRRGATLGFAWAALFLLAASSPAQDTAALVERLHKAAGLNSIDDAQLKPWHLKLSFQLFDSKGKPTEKGTIEEWWYKPSKSKTIYTSPSYTSTELRTENGFYRSKGMSYVPSLLELILRQVRHPMPSERDIADSQPDLRKETLGKTPMDCIMLAQQIKNVPFAPLGLFPTYCFDRDTDSLRVSYDFGSQLIVRNKLGTFQQRSVAVDQTILQDSITAATVHVDTLGSIEPSEDELSGSADLEEVNPDLTLVSSGVVAGLKISGVNPSYPQTSKANHVSGAVVLRAIIGTDGHIHSLKVMSTPDAALAIAALTAVRQWTYRPFLLKGEPAEIDTQITVNFNIGPSF
jgi:TonB family protein